MGKAASKLLTVNVNVPLLFVASVIADIDLLIPALEHRGPTHSLVFVFLLLLPAFLLYKRKVVPYLLALIQHSIMGDYLTSAGVQLFWPLSSGWYGVGIEITSLTNVFVELVLFSVLITTLLITKDMWILLQHHPSNLLLAIPVLTVLLPTVFGFPLHVPLELVIPHVVYLLIFALSVLIDLRYIIEKAF
jgi:membrane-bound metal-dependent hydrolase YbcI (DUF457 family)